MLGLAAGLSAGAAIVQTLRHSALSSRLIRAKRDGDTLHESLQAALAELRQARDERSAAMQSLADRTRERDQARAELADLAGERDEAQARAQRAADQLGIAQRAYDATRRELGAALEQRDAAAVARDAALRELSERTADRDGADLAHEDCERRLAEMGERLAAETLAVGQAHERERRLEREVESLKASLQAAKAPPSDPQAAAVAEVLPAPAIAPKSRRRRA